MSRFTCFSQDISFSDHIRLASNHSDPIYYLDIYLSITAMAEKLDSWSVLVIVLISHKKRSNLDFEEIKVLPGDSEAGS